MSKSRWVSDEHWRRQGKQSRSSKTQTALLDAAEILIIEKGTEGTSVADIAAKANSSVGALYHNFKDKTALYHALFHRLTDTYAQLSEEYTRPEVWEGKTLEEVFRGYVEITIQATRDTSAAKLASMAVMAENPDLASHYAEIQRKTRLALLELLRGRIDELDCARPNDAVAFALDQCQAMLRSYLIPEQQRTQLLSVTDEEFTTRVVNMICASLQLRTSRDERDEASG